MANLILSPVAFSPVQIVIIVLLCVLVVAATIGNVFLVRYFRKRRERRLCTHQLQRKREELLNELEAVRNGELPEREAPVVAAQPVQQKQEPAPIVVEEVAEEVAEEPVAEEPAAEVVAEEVSAEPEPADDAFEEDEFDDEGDEDDLAIGDAALPVPAFGEIAPAYDVLAVKAMSSNMREKFGFIGAEYDEKSYLVRNTYGFDAKLRSAPVEVQQRYRAFIDEITRYKGVKIRSSFKQQRVSKGRNVLALIMFRGKTLCIAFALNPADYADTKYRGIDKSDKKRFERTPMLLRISSDRKAEYAKYLFAQVAQNNSLVLSDKPVEYDYDFSELSYHQLFDANQLHISIIKECEDTAEEALEQAEEVEEEALEETFEDEAADVVEEEFLGGIVVRYNRSFEARIIQSSDDVKARYSEIKNHLLSYKKVGSRLSWKKESFRYGRNTFAVMAVRGKTLCISFAADPARFEGTKYKVIDKSLHSPNCKQPSLFRVSSDRKVKYAKEIIDMLMAEFGATALPDYVAESYSPEYETTEKLVERGLIKLVEGQTEPIAEQSIDEQPQAEPTEEVVTEQPLERAEEVVELPVEEVVEQVEEAEEVEEEALEETFEDEAADVVEEEFLGGIVVRYNRSFEARIIQSSDDVKARYSEIKNHLLSYKKVGSRLSWKKESFRYGRNTFAVMAVRGKTLCISFAADPARFEGTKYKVIDKSLRSPNCKQPSLFRVSSDRKVKYAKEIIDMLMAEFGATVLPDYAAENYSPEYETTEKLVERGLIKLVEGQTEPIAEQSIDEQPQAEPTEEVVTEQPLEQAEEVVELPVEEVVEQVEEAEEVEEEALEETFEDEAADVVEEEFLGGIVVRYNRSFEARIIQSSDDVKARYSEIKNHLLSYKKVGSRLSWKKESFRYDRNTFAVMAVRGKTLCISFAADPARFEGTKYKVIDKSLRSPNCKQPSLFRVSSDRKVKYAKEIIDMLMAEFGATVLSDYVAESYSPEYETTEKLVERGLIKLVEGQTEQVAKQPIDEQPQAEPTEEVVEQTVDEIAVTQIDDEPRYEQDAEQTVEEQVEEQLVVEELPALEESEAVQPVEEEQSVSDEVVNEQPVEPKPEEEQLVVEELLDFAESEEEVANEQPEEEFESVTVQEAAVKMSDEDARASVEVEIIKTKSNGDKKAVINIQTLSAHYSAGETVNLKNLREKKIVGKNVGYIKILASGTLNKPLIVEADDFSLEAIKMIVLTGGKAIRIKNN